MKIFVTGGAGFIGSHLVERLVRSGHGVCTIDNFNDYYDPELKRRNIDCALKTAAEVGRDLTVSEGDIRDVDFVRELMQDEAPDAVIHLAAMAGVRPSIEKPLLYEEVNVRGTLNLLEAARLAGVRSFIFASSSSIYGTCDVPFREDAVTDTPVSPYAATKKGGELLCHAWHHLHGLNIACLRFFTVYGPRQRPDLAIHKFTKLILEGKPLPFFGDGDTSRDYTYIDDILDGVERTLEWVVAPGSRYDIFNLGESEPVSLRRLVELIERETGKKANLEKHPVPAGDMLATYADIDKSRQVLGYNPTIPIEDGIARFVGWYRKNFGN